MAMIFTVDMGASFYACPLRKSTSSLWHEDRCLLRRARDRLDAAPRIARHGADLAVLLLDEGARRLIAVEPAKIGGRHFAVGGADAVFIDDIKQNSPLVDGGLLAGHRIFSSILFFDGLDLVGGDQRFLPRGFSLRGGFVAPLLFLQLALILGAVALAAFLAVVGFKG